MTQLIRLAPSSESYSAKTHPIGCFSCLNALDQWKTGANINHCKGKLSYFRWVNSYLENISIRRRSRSFRDVKWVVCGRCFHDWGLVDDMTIFSLQRNFTIFLPLNVVIPIQQSIQASRLNSFREDTKESLVFLLELREEPIDFKYLVLFVFRDSWISSKLYIFDCNFFITDVYNSSYQTISKYTRAV